MTKRDTCGMWLKDKKSQVPHMRALGKLAAET